MFRSHISHIHVLVCICSVNICKLSICVAFKGWRHPMLYCLECQKDTPFRSWKTEVSQSYAICAGWLTACLCVSLLQTGVPCSHRSLSWLWTCSGYRGMWGGMQHPVHLVTAQPVCHNIKGEVNIQTSETEEQHFSQTQVQSVLFLQLQTSWSTSSWSEQEGMMNFRLNVTCTLISELHKELVGGHTFGSTPFKQRVCTGVFECVFWKIMETCTL